MALPTSAPKVTCTLSKPLLADGTVGSITSATLKIDRDLVWVDTGETLFKESVPVDVVFSEPEIEGTLSFEVIPVDVNGMRDSAGAAIQNWTYTLRVSVLLTTGVSRTVDYTFQPITGDLVMDLDLVPHQNVVTIPPVVETGEIDGGAP